MEKHLSKPLAWSPSPQTGFLIQPEPLIDSRQIVSSLDSAALAALENAVRHLPKWLAEGRAQAQLRLVPPLSARSLEYGRVDELLLERLFMLLGYCASAYVLGSSPAADRLPANLARPLAALGRRLGRPPMLSYSGMVLGNWRLIDTAGPMTPDNLDVLVRFTELDDERWFFVVHAAIEARAGEILQALREADEQAELGNERGLLPALRQIDRGLVEITRIFHRMPERVDPDRYYQQVRPYLFGFDHVTYEGVAELKGKAQHLRGGSGAQSAIVPALLSGLGVRHSGSELTQHLEVLQSYIPGPHRRFILELQTARIRTFASEHAPARDAYNHVLQQLMTFRRAHLYYARTYIFEKSTDPTGTGGTAFMTFLQQLIDETNAHLL